MSKHGCFDEQSRQCLLQVVQLLNNLESMSQDDNEFSLDDDHFNMVNVSKPKKKSPQKPANSIKSHTKTVLISG